MSKLPLNRRRFLQFGGLLTALGLGAGASKAVPAMSAAMTPPLPGIPHRQEMTPDEMDAMHEAGVKEFVANIGKDKEFWGVQMPYAMDGDVKVFKLTCTEGKWTVAPGIETDAMLYNGRIPGETIRSSRTT
jgi:manganese oxidase